MSMPERRIYRRDEDRAAIKERILSAIHAIKAEGTYPSLKAICVRVPGIYEDLIRALRAELVGARKVDLGRRTSDYPDQEDHDSLKARILEAAEALEAEGAYPSVRAITARIGYRSESLVYTLRLELIADGELDLGKPVARQPEGLDDGTPEQVKEVEDRRLEVLAEKLARGEGDALGAGCIPYRVVKFPDPRSREHRR
jgi:hypothetical protein